MFTGKEPISVRDGNTEDDILREARQRAKKAEEAWSYNYDEAKKDVSFLSGAQWNEREKTIREQEGRPALTLNQLPKFIDQVVGDQRQNKPAISVHPTTTSGGAEVISQTGKKYTLAEIYEGLIRNIEYNCLAEAAYDMAFQQAIESGFGWLRVYTDYTSNDAFEQDIMIKGIRDRFSVLIDPRAIEVDASDMNWALITELMSRAEFEKRYPDAMIGEITSDSGWWLSDDSVRVAEYFTREPVTRETVLLSDGRVTYKDEIKDVLDELAQKGITIVRSRKVKTYKVYWRKITAWEVLESKREWVGDTIPLIPVFGKNIMINGQPIYMGLIRHAKDAQRMHNYWMTTVTERIALAPKTPFVGPATAFEGYERFWNEANRKNLAYLPYNDRASSAPQRVDSAPMPAAELQMAMQGIDEIKNTIGMFDASLGQRSNEQSGRAILARQKEGDTNTFAFVDNLSRAIRRVGKILIDIIPHIYDAERVIRLRLIDGTGDNVLINQSIIDMQTGQQVLIHDMSQGKYDVVVTTGPSYNTQRMEAADSLIQFVQAVPQAGQVAGDLIAKNMDWPGAEEMAKRLKKILPPNILDPQEMQEAGIPPPQPPQPTPQEQAEMQMAQMKLQEEQIKAQALAEKTKADIALKQLELQQEQMKMGQMAQGQQQDAVQLAATVKQLVAQALAEYMQKR